MAAKQQDQDKNNNINKSSTPASHLSPDELRRKRLFALGIESSAPDPRQRQRQDEQMGTSLSSRMETDDIAVNNNNNVAIDDDNDEKDEELQAAIRLSLETNNGYGSGDNMSVDKLKQSSTTTVDGTAASDGDDDDNEDDDHVDIVSMTAFHNIMWDRTTTEDDKKRWMDQEIITPELERITSSSSTPSSLSAIPSAEDNKNDDDVIKNHHNPFARDDLMKLWGLVQRHGGPCGVLAAVQAEMLRVLLFTRDKTSMNDKNNEETTTTKAKSNKSLMDVMESVTSDVVEESMAMAIGVILARCVVRTVDQTAAATTTTLSPVMRRRVRLVLPRRRHNDGEVNDGDTKCEDAVDDGDCTDDVYDALPWKALEPWYGTTTRLGSDSSKELFVSQISVSGNDNDDDREMTLAMQVSSYLLSHDETAGHKRLHYFYRPGGVMLLALSLVESRGIDRIKNDMDDPQGTHLTSQFGHCSQELINLLLTGSATSNVFDNTVSLHSIPLRGVLRQPSIGYLTQLESLRYCTVGGYYKTPAYPIWVIGSTNHFSVMFGVSDDVLKETLSDTVLEKCRRAFKSVDCAEENGFINVSSLGSVISALNLDAVVGGESGVQTLAATLEVSGAGIILWDDFWRTTSRLLTGASLENVLHSQDDTKNNEAKTDSASLVQMAYATDHSHNTGKSDLDIAKELSLQQSSIDTRKSDEELARELQAQWDAEDEGWRQVYGGDTTVSSTMAVQGDSVTGGGTNGTDMQIIDEDDKEYDVSMDEEKQQEGNTVILSSMENVGKNQPDDSKVCDDTKKAHIESDKKPSHAAYNDPSGRQLQFEKMGDSFDLYHYNGLRGGRLSSFRVTRLSAEEAVGSSVALSSNNGMGATGFASSGADCISGGENNIRGGDLEDVVRTKWPSCVFDWGQALKNGGPPMID